MKYYSLLVWLGVAVASWVSGCATAGRTAAVERRIAEKSAAFAAADALTQANVRQGIVLPGYGPDLVYIAWGAPMGGNYPLPAADGSGPQRRFWMYRNETWSGEMGNSDGYREEAKLDVNGQRPTPTQAEKAIERVTPTKLEPRRRTTPLGPSTYIVFEYGVVKEIVER